MLQAGDHVVESNTKTAMPSNMISHSSEYIRLSDNTVLYLHDVSAGAGTSGPVTSENGKIPTVPLAFRHASLGVDTFQWNVVSSFTPPYAGFEDTLIVVAAAPEPIPKIREYAKWLWCTLYWYFQLKKPISDAGLGPGAPKKEWKVSIKAAQGYTPLLFQVERMGLVYSSSPSAHCGGSETFYSFNTTFWQIPPEVFYSSTEASGALSTLYSHPLHFALPVHSCRHPLRSKPPAPGTTFYNRFIPSLNSFLTFRTANLETDVSLLHKWMNNPRVNAFWGEAGPETHQREFLKRGLEDKHCFPVIASWRDLPTTDLERGSGHVRDAEPFGYFEIYWVKEDGLAGHTETADWDRGAHVLVGEEKFRGYHRVQVWLSSLIHYMFLADPRTMTLMLEPRVDNEKFIDYLCKAGFYKEKEITFPHKQAAVMKLKREAWDGPAC